MVYLTAGLIALAAAIAVDLVLTVGVIRRLRQHTTILAESGLTPPVPPKPGDPVRAFAATAIDGTIVSRESLAPGSLVVFLKPSCGPCEEQLPALAAALRESGRPRTTTLVVLIADATEAAHMITELEEFAVVVCEPLPGTQLQQAFGVWSAPLALTVDNSTISDVSTRVAELTATLRPSAAVIG